MLGDRSAGDLSLRMLLLHSTGVALWIGYGVDRGDWVIPRPTVDWDTGLNPTPPWRRVEVASGGAPPG